MFLFLRLCAETMTQLRRLGVKVTLPGHPIYPRISCLLNISGTFEWFSLNFTQNVCFFLSETMCKTYDSTMQTQCQGHTTRGSDLPFNFVYVPYLLNPLKEAH